MGRLNPRVVVRRGRRSGISPNSSSPRAIEKDLGTVGGGRPAHMSVGSAPSKARRHLARSLTRAGDALCSALSKQRGVLKPPTAGQPHSGRGQNASSGLMVSGRQWTAQRGRSAEVPANGEDRVAATRINRLPPASRNQPTRLAGGFAAWGYQQIDPAPGSCSPHHDRLAGMQVRSHSRGSRGYLPTSKRPSGLRGGSRG